MKTLWTTGVKDAKDKEAIRLEYMSSPVMRQRLQELIRDKRAKALDANISDAEYQSPNWAYKQADNVGYMRALKEICDLLD